MAFVVAVAGVALTVVIGYIGYKAYQFWKLFDRIKDFINNMFVTLEDIDFGFLNKFDFLPTMPSNIDGRNLSYYDAGGGNVSCDRYMDVFNWTLSEPNLTLIAEAIALFKFYDIDWRYFNQTTLHNSVVPSLFDSTTTTASSYHPSAHQVLAFYRDSIIDKWTNNNTVKMNIYNPYAYLMISFPKPPIYEASPVIVDIMCKKSYEKCLRAIWRFVSDSIAKSSLNYEQYSRREANRLKFLGIFKQFSDRFDFFATASFYMCYYTLKGTEPALLRFMDRCDGRLSFTTSNNNTGGAGGGQVNEYYKKLANDAEDFECAKLNFCPDVCCGYAFYRDPPPSKLNNSEDWLNHCRKHWSNPCSSFGTGNCSIALGENSDMRKLRENQFNITCECPIGYKYITRYNACIDIDECKLGLHNCSADLNQACYNLPGSFVCVCRLGYILSRSSSSSVKNITIANQCIPDELPNQFFNRIQHRKTTTPYPDRKNADKESDSGPK